MKCHDKKRGEAVGRGTLRCGAQDRGSVVGAEKWGLVGAKAGGFTVIELLVTIGIIVILGGLMLGGVRSASRRSKGVACESNLRQHGVALLDFVATHSVFPLSATVDKQHPEHSVYWRTAILNSTDLDGKLTKCPAAIEPVGRWEAFQSYGYNDRGVIGSGTDAPLGLGGKGAMGIPSRWPPVGEHEVIRPSEMVGILDAATAWNGLIDDGRSSYSGRYFYAPGSEAGRDRMMRRHQGRVNVVFVDGHVSAPKIEMVFVEPDPGGLAMWNRDGEPHGDRLE
jgi:prepilin-type processing-associated H-X9-DG protein